MKERISMWGALFFVSLVMIIVTLAGRAFAVRGGWEAPQDGWDFVFEGNSLPDASGFSHESDSDAWDPSEDPEAVIVMTVPGQGDTEDGTTTSADATVIQLDDKLQAGANRKFLFTHQLRPDGATPSLFEIGVTLIARWRLVPPTTDYNNEYGAGNVGVAENTDNNPDWGAGAFYASATEMAFVPPELGGHPLPIDSSNNFHAVWMTAIYDPSNRSNLLINVYLDGAKEPAATFSQTGWDTASRAAVDNVYFGLTRSPYVGTMQLDYIGAKVGVHVPVPAGLRADAGPDQVVYEGDTVYLDGSDSSEASAFSWTQIVRMDDPIVQITDADKSVASFISPALDEGVVLTFQLVVQNKKETDADTTRVTVRAANAPVISPPNFTFRIGHLSATLSWDSLIDADEYLIGIASQQPGGDKGFYVWSPENGNSYRHPALLPRWTYYYKVKANNSYGEGPESDELCVTALPNLALRPDAEVLTRVSPPGQDLALVNDGQTDANAFYTDDGINYAEMDWHGYTWSIRVPVDRVVYYAGKNHPDGGWWKTLTVEISRNGGATWEVPDFVACSPAYCFQNIPTARPDFGRYDLTFPAVHADALRIVGTPGGSAYYTGVAELEVYGPAYEEEVYVYAGEDQTAVEGEEVRLDGTQTVDATSYLWKQVPVDDEPTVTLTSEASPAPTFTAPFVTRETSLTFELQADGVGGPKRDRVKVCVVSREPPAAPEWSRVAGGLRIAFLSWEDAPGATSYAVLRSEIPGGRKMMLASGLTATEYLDEGPPTGFHFYTVRAVNLAGSADSEEIPVASLEFADLGLTSRDIGNPDPGSTSYDSQTGIVTVQANGEDIWGSTDSFRFDYRQLSGDFEVIVKAESLLGSQSWAKLGPMIRDNLKAGSVHSSVFSTVMKALSLQGRNVVNSDNHFYTVIDAEAYEFPIYLRLKKEGNTFTGFYRCPDGEWHTFSPTIMVVPEMYDPVYAGVAVTSHASGVLAEARYSHFAILGQAPSPVICFRKLPSSFAPGESVIVELRIKVDPLRNPLSLEVQETFPDDTTPLDTQGGAVSGSTITWSFSGEEVRERTVTYSLGVDPDVISPLQFSGEIGHSGSRETILGTSVLYRSPSPPQIAAVEMLLGTYIVWKANPPEEGVVGYRVYRSADGGEWQAVADFVTETYWTDGEVGSGHSYSYKVTAETFNGAESDLDLSQATPPLTMTMEVRECEDYNFGGGDSPGGPSADGIPAQSPDDLTGTDYFYQKTDFPWYDPNTPNAYRRDDPVELVRGDQASGWSIRSVSEEDWFRYTFHDVPAGNVRIALRAASQEETLLEFLWDEAPVGSTKVSTPHGDTAWADYSLAPFPSATGEHVLRVKVLQGTCHLDLIGAGFNWSGPGRETIFTEDFESYDSVGELEAAGWTIVSGSGDPSGAWQLWHTEGDRLNLTEPDLPGMNGMYVISDGDLAGTVHLNEQLVSPIIDCRRYVNLRLSFCKNINVFEEDPDGDRQICEVDIRVRDEEAPDWSDWINVFTHDYSRGDNCLPEDMDISSVADGKTIQLRWHFYDTFYDYWFAVDNVRLSGILPAPPPNPPVRHVELVGISVTLSWEDFGAQQYTVQYTDDLAHPDWQNASGSWPISETTWTGEDITTVRNRFYRVRSE